MGKSFRVFSAIACMAVLSGAPQAHAFGVAASGGVSFGSGTNYPSTAASMSTYFAGEFTLGFLGVVDVGLSYDYNMISYPSGGSPTALGFPALIGRATVPVVGIFGDVKVGLVDGFNIGYGAGAGWAIGIGPFFAVKPRVGIRFLNSRTMVDLGVMAAVSI